MPGQNDPTEIVVGANGRILVAEVGATAPADITEDPSAAWTELGYVSDEGVTFTVGQELEDVNVWQSFYAVRRLMTAKSGNLGFELAQWNRDTIPLAFGGGSVSEPAAGAYRFTPAEPGPIDERALIHEFEDGDYLFRIIIPRGMVTDDVETTLNKAPNGVLPIAFGVNGQEGVAPWYLDTNHPAFAPAGSS